jgi:hypothetical protein
MKQLQRLHLVQTTGASFARQFFISHAVLVAPYVVTTVMSIAASSPTGRLCNHSVVD